MLTGRSFRGHLLVDKCLDHMIVLDVLHESAQFAALVDQSKEIYLSLVKSDIHFVMGKIKLELDKRKSELQARSKDQSIMA